MDFNQKRVFGRTGLAVGRLGVSAGYGAPAEAFEEAFERGCNYFYWGSLRRAGMTRALRNLVAAGRREELVVAVQVYNRAAGMIAGSVERALKKGNLEYADLLILGWYNSEPAPKILDAARRLKESGKIRFLALSGHNRPAFPVLAGTGNFDAFHIRYNAAHRGAETEIFPQLPREARPGVAIFTATRWGKLLKPKLTPPGERTPRASDCYRFVLTNPDVDVCITGPKNREEMREALTALDRGPLDEAELAWMKKVGDHVHEKAWP